MDIAFGKETFMDKVFWGNTMSAYILSLAVFLALLAALWVLKKFVVAWFKKVSQKTETTVDDFLLSLLEKVVLPILYVAVFFLASRGLKIAEGLKVFIDKAAVVVITYFAVNAAVMLVDYAVNEMLVKREKDEARVKSIGGLMVLVKVLIWLIGVIVMLDNLGYKVSTILAGLGIGGIAVALAAQAILGDLFSYVSIVLDRPFQTGDFIVVDSHMGTVENIGIKTTRIRSIDGEEIVFSNSNLTSSRIKNFKRMFSRRVAMTFGVTYETPRASLDAIPGILESSLKGFKDVKFDRAHLNVLNGSSIDYELVFVVEGNDYNRYMDIRQAVNLHILDEFAKRGISLAYPTQRVITEKT